MSDVMWATWINKDLIGFCVQDASGYGDIRCGNCTRQQEIELWELLDKHPLVNAHTLMAGYCD